MNLLFCEIIDENHVYQMNYIPWKNKIKSLVKFGNAPRNKTQENFPKKQLSTQKKCIKFVGYLSKIMCVCCYVTELLHHFYDYLFMNYISFMYHILFIFVGFSFVFMFSHI